MPPTRPFDIQDETLPDFRPRGSRQARLISYRGLLLVSHYKQHSERSQFSGGVFPLSTRFAPFPRINGPSATFPRSSILTPSFCSRPKGDATTSWIFYVEKLFLFCIYSFNIILRSKLLSEVIQWLKVWLPCQMVS